MSAAERAFTMQLMQEAEAKDKTINSLILLAQAQYAIAILEGHPLPIPPLEGEIPIAQLNTMVKTLRDRLQEMGSSKVVNIEEKRNGHDKTDDGVVSIDVSLAEES